MAKGTKSVTITSIHGSKSIALEARITETGDILMQGQDVTDAPTEIFGDPVYEYWISVRSDHKDVLLEKLIQDTEAKDRAAGPDRDLAILNLIKERFSGAEASSAFMAWLKRRNVPFEFFS